MNVVSSPEICLRYCWGVSDLVDPYFQTILLRHRLTSREDQRVRSTLSCWTVLVATYTGFATTLSFSCLLGHLKLGALLSHGPIGCFLGMVGISLLLAIIYAEMYVFARSIYQLLKYDMVFPVKYIGVSAEGIRLLTNALGRAERRFMPWSDVSAIKMGTGEFIDPVSDTRRVRGLLLAKGKIEPCIEVHDTKNRVMRMRLSAIRSIEERKVLVEMIKRYARRSVEKEDVMQIVRVSKVQDIAFTQLWSNALQSKMPRVASTTLEKSALLQDGKFLIKEQIGGGGQGAIYSAEMLSSDGEASLVALKEYVLPDKEHLFDRKRATDQFEREVHLLTRLNHESIVRLLDAFVEDHRAYLVMEYVQGDTVKQMTKLRGRLSEKETVEIGLKLCEVLNHLHQQIPPVVHLDVTPDNVILQENGVLKLLDFNTSSDGSGLRTKLIAGKQRYMSPEQFRNEIDPSCDIYALGCTLFFMLTGVEPEPLTKCVVESYRSDVSKTLSHAVAFATDLEKQNRCPSVAELQKYLKSWSGAQ